MKDEEMRQQLELQLHEQYAVNNNSNLSNFMALLVTFVGIIGFYGYVLIHMNFEILHAIEALDENSKVCAMMKYSGFYIQDLMFVSVASFFIILILYSVSVYIGTKQRREQIQINKIREKAYFGKIDEKIFPQYYRNADQKNFCDFVQGPSDMFARWLVVTFLGIFFITYCKVCNYYHDVHIHNTCHCIFITSFVVFIVIMLSIRYYHFNKYKKEPNSYKS